MPVGETKEIVKDCRSTDAVVQEGTVLNIEAMIIQEKYLIFLHFHDLCLQWIELDQRNKITYTAKEN